MPARIKFTDLSIKNLTARPERYIAWKLNGDGLGVRVSPEGRKVFIYQFRFNKRARLMTLGERPYPGITLQEAGRLHAEAREKLSKGIDPGEAAVKARQTERLAETVGELAAKFLENFARLIGEGKRRQRTVDEYKRQLEKDVLPIWGNRKAKEITRRDIKELLARIQKRGAPIAANRMFRTLSHLFRFALEWEIIEHSPCAGIRLTTEASRDRILTDTEVVTLWRGLDQPGIMPAGIAIALKLILVTGQRPGEVSSIEKTDIDGDVWTIPASKAKNKLAHRVPLPPLALELVQQALPLSGASRWLFPSSPTGENGIDPNNLPRHVRVALKPDEVTNKKPIDLPRFTPHDLRRTAASHMTQAGVSVVVVDKVLNHVVQGVRAVYDRHSYDREKRHALETWARKLDALITGKTADVIAFAR